MPLPLLPLIAGIAGVASSGLAAWGQNKANRDQQQFALRQQEIANQHNIDMWNRQNAYNLPQNQRNRLINANMNPALMYKGAPQNVAGPPPQMKTEKISPQNIFSGVGQATDGIVKAAQIRQINTQIAKTAAETAGIGIQNKIARETQNDAIALANEQMQLVRNQNTESWQRQELWNNTKEDIFRKVRAESRSSVITRQFNELNYLMQKEYGIKPSDAGYMSMLARMLQTTTAQQKFKQLINFLK